eukprot:scaffold743_cov267-Pinguiococcus_pyrenoidosus.AAC.11
MGLTSVLSSAMHMEATTTSSSTTLPSNAIVLRSLKLKKKRAFIPRYMHEYLSTKRKLAAFRFQLLDFRRGYG